MILFLIIAARFSRAVLWVRRLVIRVRPTLICNPKPSDILYRTAVELRLAAAAQCMPGICACMVTAANRWRVSTRLPLNVEVPSFATARLIVELFRPKSYDTSWSAHAARGYWWPRYVGTAPNIEPRLSAVIDAADYAIGQGD